MLKLNDFKDSPDISKQCKVKVATFKCMFLNRKDKKNE